MGKRHHRLVKLGRDVYGLGSDGAFDLHDSPSDNALSETFNTWVTAIRMDSTTVPSLARV